MSINSHYTLITKSKQLVTDKKNSKRTLQTKKNGKNSNTYKHIEECFYRETN